MELLKAQLFADVFKSYLVSALKYAEESAKILKTSFENKPVSESSLFLRELNRLFRTKPIIYIDENTGQSILLTIKESVSVFKQIYEKTTEFYIFDGTALLKSYGNDLQKLKDSIAYKNQVQEILQNSNIVKLAGQEGILNPNMNINAENNDVVLISEKLFKQLKAIKSNTAPTTPSQELLRPVQNITIELFQQVQYKLNTGQIIQSEVVKAIHTNELEQLFLKLFIKQEEHVQASSWLAQFIATVYEGISSEITIESLNMLKSRAERILRISKTQMEPQTDFDSTQKIQLPSEIINFISTQMRMLLDKAVEESNTLPEKKIADIFNEQLLIAFAPKNFRKTQSYNILITPDLKVIDDFSKVPETTFIYINADALLEHFENNLELMKEAFYNPPLSENLIVSQRFFQIITSKSKYEQIGEEINPAKTESAEEKELRTQVDDTFSDIWKEKFFTAIKKDTDDLFNIKEYLITNNTPVDYFSLRDEHIKLLQQTALTFPDEKYRLKLWRWISMFLNHVYFGRLNVVLTINGIKELRKTVETAMKLLPFNDK